MDEKRHREDENSVLPDSYQLFHENDSERSLKRLKEVHWSDDMEVDDFLRQQADHVLAQLADQNKPQVLDQYSSNLRLSPYDHTAIKKNETVGSTAKQRHTNPVVEDATKVIAFSYKPHKTQRLIEFSSSHVWRRWSNYEKGDVYVAHDHNHWDASLLDRSGHKHIKFDTDFFVNSLHIVSIVIRPALVVSLVSLELGDTRQGSGAFLNDQIMTLIFTYCKSLRILRVSGAPQLGDVSLLAACSSTLRISSLHINGSLLEAGTITTKAIRQLISYRDLGKYLQELFLLHQSFPFDDPCLSALSKDRPDLVIKSGGPVNNKKFLPSLSLGQKVMTRTLKSGIHKRSEPYDKQWTLPMHEAELHAVETKLGILYGQARLAEEDFNAINL